MTFYICRYSFSTKRRQYSVLWRRIETKWQ